MKSMPAGKYRPFPPISLPDRTWPDRRLSRPPRWCSVDLRDGNQALVEPMDPARKLRMFGALVAMGLEEIEVGFPAASTLEHAFVRDLIEQKRIPDDVTIQVLTQARPEQIDGAFEALRGARRAIVHLYNSTSELQRRVVFGMDRTGIVRLATEAARRMRERAKELSDTALTFQYSPESFTGTELDFAVEICRAVMDVLEPTPERPIVLNLPATVEMATPNVYADQVEWFHRHLPQRDCAVLSVHPHNDRGTAVAAAELAMLAGADRVEGTLFGNGERTGNVDLVTLALNLYTQGIDPGLAIWDIDALVKLCEECTGIPVHPRHPYAGELVYTAFSGSHQDAIHKGLEALANARSDTWEVPYLPIDPADVGRGYEGVIRLNSQSGKGGVAHVLRRELGLRVPRAVAVEMGRIVQIAAEANGGEIAPSEVVDLFVRAYLPAAPDVELGAISRLGDGRFAFEVTLSGRPLSLAGTGRGPVDAFVAALGAALDTAIEVADFAEHALEPGADAQAAAFVELAVGPSRAHGIGRDRDIVRASLLAVLCAVHRHRAAAG
jgi:2-isopropylmalate synthase